VYLEIHRSLDPESKRLEQEAKKMEINRQTANGNGHQFVETDESLIYRIYCKWFKVKPMHIDFWDMSGIYKTTYRTALDMPERIIL
jgi:hypothetical protein